MDFKLKDRDGQGRQRYRRKVGGEDEAGWSGASGIYNWDGGHSEGMQGGSLPSRHIYVKQYPMGYEWTMFMDSTPSSIQSRLVCLFEGWYTCHAAYRRLPFQPQDLVFGFWFAMPPHS